MARSLAAVAAGMVLAAGLAGCGESDGVEPAACITDAQARAAVSGTWDGAVLIGACDSGWAAISPDREDVSGDGATFVLRQVDGAWTQVYYGPFFFDPAGCDQTPEIAGAPQPVLSVIGCAGTAPS